MKTKKAKTRELAQLIQEEYRDQAHGAIQWKGTDVCIDIRCDCDETFHIDAEFMYNIECPYCGRVYLCNNHIELIQLEVRPEVCVVKGVIE